MGYKNQSMIYPMGINRYLICLLIAFLSISSIAQPVLNIGLEYNDEVEFSIGNINSVARARAGIRVDSELEEFIFARIGFLLAQSKGEHTRIWIYHPWLNYSIVRKRYNTPITLGIDFLNTPAIKGGVEIDYYEHWRFLPNLYFSIEPWRLLEK
jgi:hypothetical protein